jgi:hypothetical protein
MQESNKIDKFPYKKYHSIKHNINTLFGNLINFKPELKQTQKYKIFNSDKFANRDLISNTFDNNSDINYYQFINNDDENYETINILSDYFSEKCRMKCKRYDMIRSPFETFNNNNELNKLINELKVANQEITPYNLRELLYKHGECANFKLTLAKSIYDYFDAKRILDFSAGWGDRLISAIAYNNNSEIDYYDGFDPSECMAKYYNKIINKLANKNQQEKFGVIKLPFEKVILTRTYNLVFTSPPFFVLEIYNNDATQSTAKYTTTKSWFCNMLCVWLAKAWTNLEYDGHMVINIEDIIKDYGPNKTKMLFTEAMILFISGFCKHALFKGVIGHSNTHKSHIVRPLWVWKKTKLQEKQQEQQSTFRERFKTQYKEEYNDLVDVLDLHNI